MSAQIIFHIDVNSAFLSWTALDRLRDGDDVDLRLIPSTPRHRTGKIHPRQGLRHPHGRTGGERFPQMPPPGHGTAGPCPLQGIQPCLDGVSVRHLP